MSENKIPRIKVKNKKSGTWEDVLPLTMQPYNDGDLKDSIKKLEGKIVIDELGQDPIDTDAEVYFDLAGNDNFSNILVPEAPQDGKLYLRKNGAWYPYPEASVIESKVTKISGKGLSTNDFTDAEKSKLTTVAENANNYVHPNSHPATMISQDESHRFVTDIEKTKWENKSNIGKCDVTPNVNNHGEIFNDYVNNKSTGKNSHSEGESTSANGDYSHAEGTMTIASGIASHAEGGTVDNGIELEYTEASGAGSHAEGLGTKASGAGSHSEGESSVASGDASHSEGVHYRISPTEVLHTEATGMGSHAEGGGTKASGDASHSEGGGTKAIGNFSHSEGRDTVANGLNSHSEGDSTKAIGRSSHAEGGIINTSDTTIECSEASGEGSHAEGLGTKASGAGSHSEGIYTKAESDETHSEGSQTIATGRASHSEGAATHSIGITSHAEGLKTVSIGNHSHSEGKGTKADNFCQHSQGCYNTLEDTPSVDVQNITKTLFSIGNGTSDTDRSDALKMLGDGTTWISGIGTFNGKNVDKTNSLQAVLNRYDKEIKENARVTAGALCDLNEKFKIIDGGHA